MVFPGLGVPEIFAADKFAAGVTKLPRDCPSLFCEALGLTVDEPNGKWAQIKQAVYDILQHRDLIGKPPSFIRDHATKTAMAEQLEAIHLATFSPLKPSSYRRDLVHRIFAYQMMRLRGEIRRKGGEGANFQQMPSQPGTPSTLASPSVQATPSTLATPEPSTPVKSLETESPITEPLSVGSLQLGSPVAKPRALESRAMEFHPVGSPIAGFHPAGSPVVGSHSTETLGEMEVEGVASQPPAARPQAPGFPGMGPLSTQMWRGPPGRVLTPVPVVHWHKEVVITTIVPSAPGLIARFTKSHLLEGPDLSMARFFQILGEEGFQGEPGDYIVRDEFNNRLASQRHLAVAFQLLTNKEKLATTWRVLKKAEDGSRFPRPVPGLNPPAPPATTSSFSGSSERGLLSNGQFPKSDIAGPAHPSKAPVLRDSAPKGDCKAEDHANGVKEPQLPNPPKAKKKSFLDISDLDSDDNSS